MKVLSQDGTQRVLGYRSISTTTPLYVSAGLSRDIAFAAVNRANIASIAIIVLGAIPALSAANFVGVYEPESSFDFEPDGLKFGWPFGLPMDVNKVPGMWA